MICIFGIFIYKVQSISSIHVGKYTMHGSYMVDAYDLLATRFHSVRAVRAVTHATGTLSIPGPEEDSGLGLNPKMAHETPMKITIRVFPKIGFSTKMDGL